MKLTKLTLQNYRRFEDFEITFHPELTVIAARNGQGKTTALEAIAAALGPFVGAFDMGKSQQIARTDARFSVVGNGFENEQNFPVVIQAEADEPAIQWQRALNSPKGRTTTKEAAPLADWGKQLQSEIRDDPNTELPVVAYYPSSRLWVNHKDVSGKSVISGSRSLGYEDCLTSSSSFKQMQKWVQDATRSAQQETEFKGYQKSNLKPRLDGIQRAVNQAMQDEGWSEFHYSFAHGELVMWHVDHGLLPVSLLSDGVRAMISLVADIAFRCARLNGHLNEQAPELTPGIVLIDEVDLHLHPAWQQRVINSLRSAFPNIQFIVSTHSPQVLSSVHKESIRTIGRNADGKFVAEIPLARSYGEISSDVLETIMLVDPYPPIAERKDLNRLVELVDQGYYQTQEADSLFKKLAASLGENHPALVRLQRSIQRQEVLKK
ncbi:AAA family ATPase [Oceanimonas sp. CHS3-5]|uniref:AAA family ATPase n=1 Tax=Oceanimonas sp. CHS3-5 TaxID=3068186 RepID=UPI00273FBD34|nr:AAA family ATPase [Oceanimonas sp. CHS3-5]MDP5292456.1 AAA family ATPase [Oceanimonas sp. CHS3-5]